MNIKKRLKEIDNHFNQITAEELERNLIKAGINEIQSSEKAGMIMITDVDLQNKDIKHVYSPCQTRYGYDNLPNKVYFKIEVA